MSKVDMQRMAQSVADKLRHGDKNGAGGHQGGDRDVTKTHLVALPKAPPLLPRTVLPHCQETTWLGIHFERLGLRVLEGGCGYVTGSVRRPPPLLAGE